MSGCFNILQSYRARDGRAYSMGGMDATDCIQSEQSEGVGYCFTLYITDIKLVTRFLFVYLSIPSNAEVMGLAMSSLCSFWPIGNTLLNSAIFCSSALSAVLALM